MGKRSAAVAKIRSFQELVLVTSEDAPPGKKLGKRMETHSKYFKVTGFWGSLLTKPCTCGVVWYRVTERNL